MTEQVLVFDDFLLQGFSSKIPGFSTSSTDINRFEEVCMNLSYFADREEAEKCNSMKQIIPYSLLYLEEEQKYLVYRRTKRSGEGRLHNKWSIGIGGHINPCDLDNDRLVIKTNMLWTAAKREIHEELEINKEFECWANKGLLYDPSNTVGRVHFGFIIRYIVDILVTPSESILPKEDTLVNVMWRTPQEILELPNLENWSKIILESLAKDNIWEN